jgi:hypothetical protein
MRKLVIILLVILSTAFAQIKLLNPGEQLLYTLQFNFIRMGEGSLSVNEDQSIDGVSAHHVTFAARTSKFADRIFKVRDKVDIWLDKDDLTSLKIIKKIREGDYHKNFYTVLDYDNSYAITNNDTITLMGRVRDPYSLLFYLRTIPLEVGQILDFTTLDNKKITSFQVIVEGRETVETPSGSYYCKIIRPFRDGKSLLKNKGDMIIWLSDDEQSIPIQIQIKLNFGSMLLQLKSSNL